MKYWPIAVALALFLAGFAAGSCGKASNHEIDVAQDSVRIYQNRADQSEKARIAVAEQEGARTRAALRVADSAVAAARSAGARRPQVLTKIVEREAPEDTAVARRVAVAVSDSLDRTEIRPRDQAIDSLRVLLLSAGRILTATQASLEAAQAASGKKDVEIKALRSARPSWLSRNGSKILIPIGVFGGWWLRGQLEGKVVVASQVGQP